MTHESSSLLLLSSLTTHLQKRSYFRPATLISFPSLAATVPLPILATLTALFISRWTGRLRFFCLRLRVIRLALCWMWLDYISPWPVFSTFRPSGTWSQKLFIYSYIPFPFLYFWAAGVCFEALDFNFGCHKNASASCPDHIIYSALDYAGVINSKRSRPTVSQLNSLKIFDALKLKKR